MHDDDDEYEMEEEENLLLKYCVDVTEAAENGYIDPVIGRSPEIERTIQVLCRRKKGNPILVGEAGTGKTSIVEGLALRIVNEEVPVSLLRTRIYSLNLASVVAGSKFRGQFEERMEGLISYLQREPDSILFIDEIHTMIGAGATTGGTLDAANILKPALASGAIRCIGATTYDEFRTTFEKDKALMRRFLKIDVKETSPEETYAILKSASQYYGDYHGVAYTEEALQAIVELSNRYILERSQPDKALDVMDEAGAYFHSLVASSNNLYDSYKFLEYDRLVIDVEHIEAIVSKIARIPNLRVDVDEQSLLENLEKSLKEKIFGQDIAIESLVEAVTMHRAGFSKPDKPVGSFLLVGPTGVGKTEIAKQLAESLQVDFVKFDMTEYSESHAVSKFIGSPPGYIGSDQSGLLTEAIRKKPRCVLLLDEIEKAHPSIFNILLQVMDSATLTDNAGRIANFRDVIVIMTSNVGSVSVKENVVGFGKVEKIEVPLSTVDKVFSPEFRNRLDDIITFSSLDKNVMLNIVGKFIRELDEQLSLKNVKIRVSESARNWLADQGYDPSMGARPLGRVIKKHIQKPLSQEILFGKLSAGGTVRIGYSKRGGLQFRYPEVLVEV